LTCVAPSSLVSRVTITYLKPVTVTSVLIELKNFVTHIIHSVVIFSGTIFRVNTIDYVYVVFKTQGCLVLKFVLL